MGKKIEKCDLCENNVEYNDLIYNGKFKCKDFTGWACKGCTNALINYKIKNLTLGEAKDLAKKEKNCIVCGVELGIFGKTSTNAGALCKDCYKTCHKSFDDAYLAKEATVEQIKNCCDETINVPAQPEHDEKNAVKKQKCHCVICSKCGKENKDDSNFCIACGNVLESVADTSKNCINCGKIPGAFKGITINAGILCKDCFRVCHNSFDDKFLLKEATIDDIKSCFSGDGEIAISDGGKIVYDPKTWQPTKVVASYFEVDENNKLWLIPDGFFGGKKSPTIHKYDEILEFELLEDGNSITKGGLGRAAVGGLLLGGVGAIIGGVTGGKRSQKTVNKLQIKITMNNMNSPTAYITLIKYETKVDSLGYKSNYKAAQEILSILSLITKGIETEKKENVSAPQLSAADEIRKFKQLLDDGIITEDEFKAKKEALLQ